MVVLLQKTVQSKVADEEPPPPPPIPFSMPMGIQQRWVSPEMSSHELLGKVFTLIPGSQRQKLKPCPWPIPEWVSGHMLLVSGHRFINGPRGVVKVHTLTTTLQSNIPRGWLVVVAPNNDTHPSNGNMQLHLRNWTAADISSEQHGLKGPSYVRCDNSAEVPVDWLLPAYGNDERTMQLDERSWFLLNCLRATPHERVQNSKALALKQP